ncbi:substrate-binding domain-containing protein [Yoonia sp. GPGPB17]|uniref:substrate-binding domain-containing protein n=1 Tax=Yoonia sp. GPGPB17 TaxID=3026147 RepID=UPI0040407AE4
MQQQTPPHAIYFANDDLAAGGLMHCLAEGVSTPEQVALAGFNGLSFLSALPKLITTTVTPRFDIGTAAAKWLMQPDEETAIRKVVLEATLRIGDTT